MIELRGLPGRRRRDLGREHEAALAELATERVTSQVQRAEISAMVDASPLGIITYDRAGLVRTWSPAAAEILGWSEEEVIGRPSPLVQPEKWHEFAATLERAMVGERRLGLLLSRVRKDGTGIRIRASTAPIRAADGEIVGMISVIEDMTERDRIQQQLDRLYELSPDIVCVIGHDGYLHRVNPAFGLALGYDEQQLLARPVRDLMHPDDRETAPAANPESCPDLTKDAESRWRCADGSYRWLSWSISRFREDGTLLAIARDVTERRQFEAELIRLRDEALRGTQAKSDFLSRMSHELRTPLNAILGFAQLLALEPLDPLATESVEQVTKAGRHLLALINEILDIAQIEAGRLTLSSEPVGVRNIVDDAITLMAPLASEREIELRSAILEDSAWHVLADRQRLTQVLLNLLSNALKYSPPHTSVVVSATMPTADSIRINVDDEGPGIAPADRERLFEPFERLPTPATPGIEGTGLGLTLSKGLVELMGGTLGLDARDGSGTTFWLDLAREEPPPDPAARVAEALLDQAEAVVRPCTVLYVEDNLANLRLIERILAARPGVRLLSAMQGRLGIDLARKHLPDVILLDLHLPDLHGRDVLRELRRNPATAGIPVIVVTADATPGRTQRLLDDGAAAFITKPIIVNELLTTLEAVVPAPADDHTG